MGLYSLLLVLFYQQVSAITSSNFQGSFFHQILVFLGGSKSGATSPLDYFNIFFLTPLSAILGVFVASSVAGLLEVNDQAGPGVFTLSDPIQRSGMFWGRVIGFLGAFCLILGAAWITWLIPGRFAGLDLEPGAVVPIPEHSVGAAAGLRFPGSSAQPGSAISPGCQPD